MSFTAGEIAEIISQIHPKHKREIRVTPKKGKGETMRVKTGIVRRRRHKKVLKQTKGFYSGRRKHFRKAKEQLERSLCYAFRDRKQKKRDFRSLWIIRINAACRMQDISYSKFMHGLKLANIEMDRKILADMALNDIESFNKLVQTAKGAMK